jgi:hypothetical protein
MVVWPGKGLTEVPTALRTTQKNLIMPQMSFLRFRLSDRQLILLLVGGFLFMVAGSWFSQFDPERQARAARMNGQETPTHIHQHPEAQPAVYAEATTSRR